MKPHQILTIFNNRKNFSEKTTDCSQLKMLLDLNKT